MNGGRNGGSNLLLCPLAPCHDPLQTLSNRCRLRSHHTTAGLVTLTHLYGGSYLMGSGQRRPRRSCKFGVSEDYVVMTGPEACEGAMTSFPCASSNRLTTTMMQAWVGSWEAHDVQVTPAAPGHASAPPSSPPPSTPFSLACLHKEHRLRRPMASSSYPPLSKLSSARTCRSHGRAVSPITASHLC